MATRDTQVVEDDAVEITLARLATVVLGVVAVVAAGLFAARLVQVVGLVLGAVTMALITLPMQRWLRTAIGQAASLIVTAVVTTVGALGLAFIAVRDLSARTDRVADLVTLRLDEVPSGSLIGRVITATRLDVGVAQWLDDLPSRVVVGGDSGTAIATQIFLFLTVVVLATFLQSSGGRIIDWIVGRWPREAGSDDRRDRGEMRALLDDIERRGIGVARRTFATAGVVAGVVGGVGLAVDVPGAVALGLWVGAWAVAPVVGPAVAILPAALLLALDQRLVAGVVLLVTVAAVVAARWARRRWLQPLVHVGAGPHVLGVAAGIAIAGVGGSIVAFVAIAALLAAMSSVHRWSRPEPWRLPAERTWQIGGITLPSGWRLVVLAVVATSASVVSWVALLRLGRGAVWLLVGGFVAIALSRPVDWLSRRGRIDRRFAGAIVCLVVGAAVLAAALTGADDGAQATTRLTKRLPSIVSGLEDVPVIGGWLEQRDAAVWVEEQMSDLPQRVRTGRPADWLPFFGDRIMDLFWVAVIAVALLVDGPRTVAGLTRTVPARHRRQWTRLVGATGVALGGYAAGAALVATINASVIFVVAVLLGLGVAPALALWGFLWNFVPQIGGFMGGLPLVVFALVLGPLQGLFAAVVFIAYQFVENHLIQPAVIGAAIDIAPWGTLLAAIAGAAAAGVVGAIVLTPLVGVIGVIRRELAREDFPGSTVGGIVAAPD